MFLHYFCSEDFCLNRFMKSHEAALEDNFIDLSSVTAEWKTLKICIVTTKFGA